MSVSSAVSARSAMSFRSTRSDASKASTAGRSQFHWQKFRSDVLLPHHIRVLPSTSGESIPESILAYLDINRVNTERFLEQRTSFREQVHAGNGFGASAFFPSDVLPTISGQPLLARCMVPSYSADALPERMATKAQSKSDLSIPRPSLGYGFSNQAFNAEELTKLPRHLLSTGTSFQSDHDAGSSNSALYIPFLSFERVFSGNEYGVDLASNQCAVDGAWSVRALQMLYAAAVGEDVKNEFEKPTAFSCCIDNDMAMMNYHWVDHAQTYCMAPIVRFDLRTDEDFAQLLLWIEAITQWAIVHLLPEIKRAVNLLSIDISPKPTSEKIFPITGMRAARQTDQCLPALKTDYDYAQLQLKQGLWSPSVSSTASWGSPVVDEVLLEKLTIPEVSQTRSVCSYSNIARVRFPPSPLKPLKSSLKKSEPTVPVATMTDNQSAPAYEKNSELVMKKRLGHAMDEIEELQAQMTHMKNDFSGSLSLLKAELTGMRKAMTSMVRKEKTSVSKQRSPLRINSPAWTLQAESPGDFPKNLKPLITTPTEFRPVPAHQRQTSRSPSGLSNVLTPLDTNVSAVVTVRSPKSAGSNQSPTSPSSNLSSPTSPQGMASSRTPDNVPSPSIAPSDAISCISCVSCRKAALRSKLPVISQQPEILQSIATYRWKTSLWKILVQIVIAFAFVDYLVLLFARLQTPAVSQYLKHFL